MNNLNDLYIPQQLIRSFFKEGVVAFVGSGPSINEGLLSWKQLLEKMLSEVRVDISDSEYKSVQAHIKSNDYLLVADFLKFKFRETPYRDFIEHTFKDKKIGIIQELITSIPFSGIITTNYDDLISRADTQNKFNHPFTWQDVEIFRKIKEPYILHAHGMASSPASIILSTSDYDHLKHSYLNINFWSAIQNIFQNRHVIFIGYSLNDPDFNIFLANLKNNFRGSFNEHYALIIANEDDPLNIYRLKETMSISTIHIVSNDSIGNITLKWLSKLKNEINRIAERNIIPIVHEEQNLSKVKSLTQIKILKTALIDHLVLTYPDLDSVNLIVGKFKGTNVQIDGGNIVKIWNEFVFELSNDVLRKFILFIFDYNIENPLIKRLLSHIFKD